MRGETITCPGCGNVRAKFRRGLCGTCYGKAAVRESARDLRRRDPDYSVEERNRLALDPVLCPHPMLARLAHNVIARFGRDPRIDADDLIQEGWVVLIESLPGWMRGSRAAKTVVHYALRGVKASMFAAAAGQIRGGAAGGDRGDDPFGVRDYSDRVSARERFAGWRTPSLYVSRHALLRFRERLSPSGVPADIRRLLRSASPVSPEERAAVMRHASARARRGAATAVLRNGGAVFVVTETWSRGLLRPAVHTVLTAEQVASDVGRDAGRAG